MIVREDHPDIYADGQKQLTVKQLDADQQPREKARMHGIGTLSLSELWAVVLRTGLPGKPITQLCRELMKNNGDNLHTLERRTHKELTALPGIGATKAIQIEAVMEIVRRYCGEKAAQTPQIRTSLDAADIMRPRIGNLDHEEIWAIMLSRSNKVTRLYRASSGGRAATVFDVKVILKEALLENATSLMLCHNHPSGNLTPSGPDDSITRKCAEACRAVDILFLDHLILTAESYYSYADQGRL